MDNRSGSRDGPSRQPPTGVLALVEWLAAHPPVRVRDVESVIGVALAHAPGFANEYYEVYAAESVAPFTRVEWRTPVSSRATGESILLLSLASDGCIDSASVRARFGTELDDLRPSAPTQHSAAAGRTPGDGHVVYHVYRKPWGTLSFGIRRGSPECLQTVVLAIQTGQRRVQLRYERSARNAYYLAAHMEDRGALVIEGHDLGAAPAAFWGSSEYEWEISITREDVPTYVTALGGTPDGDDPLDLLAARFAEDERCASRAFLEEHGIPFRFWSRVGN